ncbi:hypothetical protein H5410_021103 [Solanum commersonii]|uniref:Uncharacterized protein n=1 Tax=Solanum commersonii TaxID=4109 RepID=A0A9J5ZG66_SOLCO|nr:hypothetical protein H5410_021103 [Solanum commersonii]
MIADVGKRQNDITEVLEIPCPNNKFQRIRDQPYVSANNKASKKRNIRDINNCSLALISDVGSSSSTRTTACPWENDEFSNGKKDHIRNEAEVHGFQENELYSGGKRINKAREATTIHHVPPKCLRNFFDLSSSSALFIWSGQFTTDTRLFAGCRLVAANLSTKSSLIAAHKGLPHPLLTRLLTIVSELHIIASERFQEMTLHYSFYLGSKGTFLHCSKAFVIEYDEEIHTKKLVKLGKTRFATAFLTLHNEAIFLGDSNFTWGVATEASGVEENHYGLRGNTSILHMKGKEVATSLSLIDGIEEYDDGVEEEDN